MRMSEAEEYSAVSSKVMHIQTGVQGDVFPGILLVGGEGKQGHEEADFMGNIDHIPSTQQHRMSAAPSTSSSSSDNPAPVPTSPIISSEVETIVSGVDLTFASSMAGADVSPFFSERSTHTNSNLHRSPTVQRTTVQRTDNRDIDSSANKDVHVHMSELTSSSIQEVAPPIELFGELCVEEVKEVDVEKVRKEKHNEQELPRVDIQERSTVVGSIAILDTPNEYPFTDDRTKAGEMAFHERRDGWKMLQDHEGQVERGVETLEDHLGQEERGIGSNIAEQHGDISSAALFVPFGSMKNGGENEEDEMSKEESFSLLNPMHSPDPSKVEDVKNSMLSASSSAMQRPIWVQYTTTEGWPYYYNFDTGESSWEPPVDYTPVDYTASEFDQEHSHEQEAAYTSSYEYISECGRNTAEAPLTSPSTEYRNNSIVFDSHLLSSESKVSTPSSDVSKVHGTIDTVTSKGQSALHVTAASCLLDGLLLLLKSGASDANLRDADDKTPLHVLTEARSTTCTTNLNSNNYLI